MFKHINSYAGDPIITLMEAYQLDTRPDKVNLSIGLYYNEQGIIPELQAVKKAKNILFSQYNYNSSSSYLPIEGLQPYRSATQKLLFGNYHSMLNKSCIVTIQTLGGSGALKIGADFLKRYFPHAEVWVSNPTWSNHIAIFSGAGFKVNYYPYFDKNLLCVNFSAMINYFKQLPHNSIVVLHPCCHNPTGADLTKNEWNKIIAVMAERQLIPFFDIAYQGLGANLDEDAYAVREMARLSIPFLVSHSLSKVFSLYSERVGDLSIVCENFDEAERVLGQLKSTVRCNYSSPPRFGAQIVANILNEPLLQDLWCKEINSMRLRILNMRQSLFLALSKELPHHNFDYLLRQRGMFSYIGLSREQVIKLRDIFAVYLIDNGRICLSGLNTRNISKVTKAIVAVQ